MKKLIFALVVGASAMTAAQAAGPYVGVGIATADHSYNIAGASNGNSDGYKASGKLFGGYDFDQMWGVEAGYTDFRKSTYSYNVNNVPGRVESDGNSFYVAGKATAPLNDQFAVFGKLGVARNKSDLNGSIVRSDSKTEAYGAIGAQYSLTKQVALTLEYERYGKSKDFGAKADVWTVGAKYAF